MSLKLIQLVVVMKLQHWRLSFHNNWGYSGCRSCPLITSSWTPARATCLWIMLATFLWLRRARCHSLLWPLLGLCLTACRNPMLLQYVGLLCLGRCENTSQGLQCFILRWILSCLRSSRKRVKDCWQSKQYSMLNLNELLINYWCFYNKYSDRLRELVICILGGIVICSFISKFVNCCLFTWSSGQSDILYCKLDIFL